MADAPNEAEALPPVPGFWRLGWLLFMQPLTLHRLFTAWRLEGDPSLRKLRRRLIEGDPMIRALVARLAGWLLVAPVSAGAVVYLAGLLADWVDVAQLVSFSITLGITVSFIGIVRGASFGVAFATGSAAAGAAFDTGIARNITFFIFGLVITNIALEDPMGANRIKKSTLSLFHLPLYPAEVALTAIFRLAARLRPTSLPRLAACLPYRHHDLIYLPLPFLVGLLVRLGEEHPAEGRQALTEAAASLGQKGPARRALVELQARSLERAALERRYASAAILALPFLSQRESLGAEDQSGYLATTAIAAAAQDLEAARSTGSHHQRRQALTRARKNLEQTLYLFTGARLTQAERRFVPVVKAWIDRVEDEEAALARLEQEQPQVPLVFVAGPALTPMDENLFVGRSDLVRLLDQDLAAERPVPLVLLGQRRMGKSTLLNFLPRLLGTGTRVVHLDFQGLSGNSLRAEPHRWVAVEVAALVGEEIEEASAPPGESSWGTTLNWLSTLEGPLAASDRRLLIALDEVEALERGIREGWSDPAFLDFLRAAGDRLRRIRFLLVTAHPFSRLGPHWSDRLISAQTRRIEPLREEEARMLLTQPVPGFPEIYPPGGVERLLLETACHPYLLQLTAYDLTRRLNDAGRLKATDDDLTAALDQALEENNLFQNLWDDLSSTEQGLLAALARGEEPTDASEMLGQARRELAREQLIQRRDTGEGWQVAVPLFARWIREIGAAE